MDNIINNNQDEKDQIKENKKKKRKKYLKQWHIENKEHIKKYLEDHKEDIIKQRKIYKENHKEQIKNAWGDWYKKNKSSIKRRFSGAKNIAKRRGILWKLSLEEYNNLIIMPCYYCNNILGKPVKRSIGLDRLDSNLDYELNNVVSCCYVCNTMKNINLTPEETKIAANAIISYREENKLLKIS